MGVLQSTVRTPCNTGLVLSSHFGDPLGRPGEPRPVGECHIEPLSVGLEHGGRVVFRVNGNGEHLDVCDPTLPECDLEVVHGGSEQGAGCTAARVHKGHDDESSPKVLQGNWAAILVCQREGGCGPPSDGAIQKGLGNNLLDTCFLGGLCAAPIPRGERGDHPCQQYSHQEKQSRRNDHAASLGVVAHVLHPYILSPDPATAETPPKT